VAKSADCGGAGGDFTTRFALQRRFFAAFLSKFAIDDAFSADFLCATADAATYCPVFFDCCTKWLVASD